ncbi:MAG: phospholipid carrier-dependent glycosyltransferase [Chloroflexi bacterium]|nr:phospholipid carrier-dependent glycosyltransferase [Chloroflexota bacterium]
MTKKPEQSAFKKTRLLILLVALAFRVYQLTAVPPGLTHDEANHGREAMGILDGDFRFYFPANYGSEPVYSYTAAGSMWVFGENLLALRLVNVLFGLGAMGAAYAWTAVAFDRRTALIAAGVTAVSFWPVASSREALRAGMLPFFMTLAVWFFWQETKLPPVSGIGIPDTRPKRHHFIWFGLAIAITLHIYLAARVAWLIFPIFVVYLALVDRDAFRRSWRPTLAGLVLAGLLVVPMFVYLKNNPAAQTRLTMLDGPLQALRDGNLTPVLQNAGEALLAFVWPGYGDQFLAYNIPGRPVFEPVTAVFFIVGLLISIWRWKQPNYAFLLLWFGVGVAPSLLTGATANTTRNLAALPAAMALPAVGFTTVMERLKINNWGLPSGKSSIVNLQSSIVIIWLIFAGFTAARDYFVRWGESPEVRGAYQHTLVEALTFMAVNEIEPPIVISSVYPGPAHDPSISLVLSPQTEKMRWIDARFGLLFPGGGDGRVLIPSSTPIHPELAGFVELVTAVSLREDDLDPEFALYELVTPPWSGAALANFNDAVILHTAYWTTPETAPGGTAELITVWRITDPTRIGPTVPPFDATDVVLFTQVLDEASGVLTQRDALDAPSWSWQTGDIIVQIHPIVVPLETAVGRYQTIVGIYDKLSGARLPVLDVNGAIVETFAPAPPLQVTGG